MKTPVMTRPQPRPTVRALALTAIAATVTLAMLTVPALEANASTGHGAAIAAVASTRSGAVKAVSAGCSGGRCTVWLSKSDTQKLGWGSMPPAPPASLPWQLQAAYYSLAYAHKWFAAQYANRGWCSGFRLSIYPWETQGYFGYAC